MRHKAWLIAAVSVLLSLWLTGWPTVVLAESLSQQEEPVTHAVQAGETLFKIAQQYGTTVEAIVAANDILDPGLIRVGQELVIPVASGENAVGEENVAPEASVPEEEVSILTSYIVMPGDTLDAVARRYDSTPSAIAELNGVVSPTSLPAGEWLSVPGGDARRLHRVAEGETTLGLALRYDLPPWEFLAANGVSSGGALVPGQRVWVPSEVTTNTLPAPVLALDVGPPPVLQGNTVRVKLDLASGTEVRGVFHDEVLNFAVEDGIHYALFGIHALAEPRVYTLALLFTDPRGDEVYVTQPVEILDGGFGYEEIVLPPERDALLDPQALAAERARLAEIKTVFNADRYWDGAFLPPIDTELTSFFGTGRLYQSPSYQSYGYHEGTDFDGEVGTPVYAPAPGVVMLAEELYVRGGAVVIDHGWGVYTGYWHLSQFDVVVGQRVEPGTQIALVGHTGLSTGAHLHWDFWVNGTNVRALQWTEQTFP